MMSQWRSSSAIGFPGKRTHMICLPYFLTGVFVWFAYFIRGVRVRIKLWFIWRVDCVHVLWKSLGFKFLERFRHIQAVALWVCLITVSNIWSWCQWVAARFQELHFGWTGYIIKKVRPWSTKTVQTRRKNFAPSVWYLHYKYWYKLLYHLS